MNGLVEFRRMMVEQTEMALATVDGDSHPNVRIVNFYYDVEEDTLYFATFKENDKVVEIEQHPTIAFTTIPKRGNEHIKAKGEAKQSKKTIYEMASNFCEKIPRYQETIDFAGELLLVFEILLNEATVTLDLSNTQHIHLQNRGGKK